MYLAQVTLGNMATATPGPPCPADSVLALIPHVGRADGVAMSYPRAGSGLCPLFSQGPVRPGLSWGLGVTGGSTGQGWSSTGFKSGRGLGPDLSRIPVPSS